jgi:hypothetical protein
LKGKFLSDPKYAFTLEAYANLHTSSYYDKLPKEVDIAQAVPFLLTTPDFVKTEVVKDYSNNIVAPATDCTTGNTQLKSRKGLRWSE